MVPTAVGRLILHVSSGERRSRAQDRRQGSLEGGIYSLHPRVNRPDDISPQSAVSTPAFGRMELSRMAAEIISGHFLVLRTM
jgi:hypothetical protein